MDEVLALEFARDESLRLGDSELQLGLQLTKVK